MDGKQANRTMRRVAADWLPALWRRKVLLLGLMVVLVLGTRLAWGWWVGRQVDAVLAEIRARGEPAGISDVTIVAVADEQNAWAVQLKAIGALAAGVDSPRSSNMIYPNYPPYSQAWEAMAGASEQAQHKAFVLARDARGRRAVQVRKELSSPVILSLFAGLTNTKMLANALGDGAIYVHLKGDDAEAIERVRDVLHLSRSLRHDDFPISQLVAIGVDSVAYETLQIIAPGLSIDGRAMTRPAMRPVSRRAVQEVIDELLDEELCRRGIRRGLLGERLGMIDYLNQRAARVWFIRPLAGREFVRMSRNFEAMIEAAGQPTRAAAQAVLDRCEWEPALARPVGMMIMPAPKPVVPRYSRWYHENTNLEAYIERHFRSIAERRATALILALQLYRADHGRFPGRLEELTPAYLPAVPPDPFRADGGAMVMVNIKAGTPAGADRPMIYYEAGPDAGVIPEPWFGWRIGSGGLPNWQARQYRDLTRFDSPAPRAPAAAGASTEAVDDDPEEADAPGDRAKEQR